MLHAIIFDFDGIIVNSEPLIVKLTQQMAALEGWTVTEEEYYRDYLALDDRGIIEHLFRTHGCALTAAYSRLRTHDWTGPKLNARGQRTTASTPLTCPNSTRLNKST